MSEADLQRLLANPFIRELMAGRMVLPLNPSGARTDRGANGEWNLYVSGATIVMQVYSADNAAWTSEVLT